MKKFQPVKNVMGDNMNMGELRWKYPVINCIES